MKASNVEYLFHWSPIPDLSELIPKQARSGANLDGEPAVFATHDLDYATFMALIGSNRWGGWDGGRYPGKGFYIYEEFLEYLTTDYYDIDGVVYFLDKACFEKLRGSEYISTSPVVPLGSIAVSYADLPANITILDEPHPSRKRKN